MQVKTRIIINKFFIALTLLSLALLIIPTVLEGFWALPDGDDFNFMSLTNKYLEMDKGYFHAGYSAMIEKYLTWQGTYFTNFIIVFLSPFIRFGIYGYSIFCIIGIVLYFFVLCIGLYFIKYLLNIRDNLISVVLMALCTYSVLTFSYPADLLYWFTAQAAYIYPFLFSIIGMLLIKFSLTSKDNKKIVFAFMSGIFLFISCGGTLQIAGFSVSVIISICLFINKQYIYKSYLIFSVVVGTTINIVAPGNSVRMSYLSNEQTNLVAFFNAIVHTFLTFYNLATEILIKPGFWLVFFSGIYLGRFCMKKIPKRYFLKILFCMFFVTFSSTIPVCIGYGTSILSDRTKSILVILVTYIILTFALLVGKMIADNSKTTNRFFLAPIIVSSLFFVFYPNLPISVRAYQEIKSGLPQESYSNWIKIYDEVNNSLEKSVTVEVDSYFIDNLLVKNTYAHYEGKIFLSPSYINYTGKKEITINWNY